MHNIIAYNLRNLGIKTIIILISSILIGFLDAIGIISLIPLFEGLTTDQIPKNNKFYKIFNYTGLSFNINNLVLIVFSLFILKGIIKFLSNLYVINTMLSYSKNLRIELINRYNNLNVKYLSKIETGQIQNNLTTEITMYIGGIRQSFMILRDITMVLIYISIAFLSNNFFSILIIICSTIYIGGFYILNFMVKKISRKLVKINHKFNIKILEHVRYIKYLNMSGAIKKTTRQIINLIVKRESLQKKSSLIQSFLTSFKEPILITILFSSIYVYTSYFNGDLNDIAITIILFIRTLQKNGGLQEKMIKLNSKAGTFENIERFKIFLHKNKQVTNNRDLIKYTCLESKIRVRNLNLFIEEKKILSNINLDIKKNERVAFIGESGGGKSSLINTIAGFYKIEYGYIYFDNISLNQIDLNAFHKTIGFVSQNPVIFHASVFDNITLWDEKNEINQKRFLNVIKQVMIDETIFNLPLKEDTLIEKNGENFSQGQNQRICIARELYKKPSLLFLDEATSSLDSEMKDYIIKTIVKTYTNMTLISVSHDLSNLTYFDKIYQVHKGEIIHGGNFNQLFKKSKSFRNMVEIQKING